MEQDDLVDAVQELRPERRAHHRHHRLAHRLGVFAFRLIDEELRTEVRGHHDQRVAEVDRVALPVGQPPVVEHLQQHVEHVRVRLLDLVEQDHLIGPPPHRFGQRAALVVSDVAGRRADQPRDRMLLHVLRHVDADERGLVVEQVFGERLGELGLADAGRPEEHERADRPVRVLQAGARAAHRSRDRLHGFGLADDALGKLLLHAQQLFLLAFEHAVDRHAGPARDDLRDVVGGDRLFDHRAGVALAFDRLELLLKLGDSAVGELAGLLEFAACAAHWRARCAPASSSVLSFCASESLLFSACQRAVRSADCFSSAVNSFSRFFSRAFEPASLSFFSASCSIFSRTISRSIESSSSGLESTCIFSRAAASSTRSIALSGRKRSVM